CMVEPPKLTRWGHRAPTREFLEERLRRERLEPHWWSNGSGERYAGHSHDYHKVLYCQAGSVTFQLPASGDELELRPGDRLDLPASWVHSAVVGPEGVT